MKRQTFADNIGVLCVILCICAVTALFSAIMHLFPDITDKNDLAANSKTSVGTVVVIDPGHGGEDGGAVGVSGTYEKDINLAISKDIAEFFAITGYDCYLTRNTDKLMYDQGQESRKKYHDVRNRVKFTKTFDNPVFVSIHQNKFPVEKYSGLQVYYSANNRNSSVIAESIQNNTKTYLQPDNSRKTKEAVKNIFVLSNLECPAVLVECGFLSNSREEELLCNEEYQRKIAFIIFKSIVENIAGEMNESA